MVYSCFFPFLVSISSYILWNMASSSAALSRWLVLNFIQNLIIFPLSFFFSSNREIYIEKQPGIGQHSKVRDMEVNKNRPKSQALWCLYFPSGDKSGKWSFSLNQPLSYIILVPYYFSSFHCRHLLPTANFKVLPVLCFSLIFSLGEFTFTQSSNTSLFIRVSSSISPALNMYPA